MVESTLILGRASSRLGAVGRLRLGVFELDLAGFATALQVPNTIGSSLPVSL